MDPQLLRAGFRIGFLVLALAILTLPFQPRDSAEFVVTLLAAVVGGTFVLGVVLLARMGNPPIPHAKLRAKGYNKGSTGREHRP